MGVMDMQIHAFLTSALGGREWLGSRPGCFDTEEEDPQYPIDWRLGGPQGRSSGLKMEAVCSSEILVYYL
jgi:hypothetical protein